MHAHPASSTYCLSAVICDASCLYACGYEKLFSDDDDDDDDVDDSHNFILVMVSMNTKKQMIARRMVNVRIMV